MRGVNLISLAIEFTGTHDTSGESKVRNSSTEVMEMGGGKLELKDKLVSLHQLYFLKIKSSFQITI